MQPANEALFAEWVIECYDKFSNGIQSGIFVNSSRECECQLANMMSPVPRIYWIRIQKKTRTGSEGSIARSSSTMYLRVRKALVASQPRPPTQEFTDETLGAYHTSGTRSTLKFLRFQNRFENEPVRSICSHPADFNITCHAMS